MYMNFQDLNLLFIQYKKRKEKKTTFLKNHISLLVNDKNEISLYTEYYTWFNLIKIVIFHIFFLFKSWHYFLVLLRSFNYILDFYIGQNNIWSDFIIYLKPFYDKKYLYNIIYIIFDSSRVLNSCDISPYLIRQLQVKIYVNISLVLLINFFFSSCEVCDHIPEVNR